MYGLNGHRTHSVRGVRTRRFQGQDHASTRLIYRFDLAESQLGLLVASGYRTAHKPVHVRDPGPDDANRVCGGRVPPGCP